MPTFSRRGLHGHVVDHLGERIVQGEIPPGAVIDVAALEVELAVSRTVVREAVKVLTTKGLLDARPRLGTFVRDRAQWNMLDADVIAWRSRGGPADASRLLSDLAESRRVVEPWAARLAAERRTAGDLALLLEAQAVLASRGSQTTEAHVAADAVFHRTILSATGNELLAQLAGLLEPALRMRDAIAFAAEHDESFVHLHQAVVDAIRAGDASGAEAAMTALVEEAGRDVAAAVNAVSLPIDTSR